MEAGRPPCPQKRASHGSSGLEKTGGQMLTWREEGAGGCTAHTHTNLNICLRQQTTTTPTPTSNPNTVGWAKKTHAHATPTLLRQEQARQTGQKRKITRLRAVRRLRHDRIMCMYTCMKVSVRHPTNKRRLRRIRRLRRVRRFSPKIHKKQILTKTHGIYAILLINVDSAQKYTKQGPPIHKTHLTMLDLCFCADTNIHAYNLPYTSTLCTTKF